MGVCFCFSDNAAMPTLHIRIGSIFLSLCIVDIKKCANFQQIRSERVNQGMSDVCVQNVCMCACACVFLVNTDAKKYTHSM